jgi:uncharacterized protein HemX
MLVDTTLIALVVLSVVIIPGLALYYHFKIRWDNTAKKRKIAEFIEKASEQQIQAKDGPE